MKRLLPLLIIGTAHAGQYGVYDWQRVADIPDSQLTVIVKEIAEPQMRVLVYGTRQDPRQAPLGRSILSKTEDGRYVCRVYLLDRDDKPTIEHELKHCHGWIHSSVGIRRQDATHDQQQTRGQRDGQPKSTLGYDQ